MCKEETEKRPRRTPHKNRNNKLQIQHKDSQGNACMLPLIPALR